MEVPNQLSNMRFPPVLLAVFTVSAALGLSNPVQAETLSPMSTDRVTDRVEDASKPELPYSSPVSISSKPSIEPIGASESTPLSVLANSPTPSPALPVLSTPERFTPEFMAQTLDSAPGEEDAEGVDTPGNPPPGSQTPESDGSNELQFEIDGDPSIEVEVEGSNDAPPTADPSTTPLPEQELELTPAPETESSAEEPRVLVAEVVVSGATTTDLQTIVYDAILTQPGRTTTRSQLQEDINAVFATGYFSNVRVTPEDTPLGVRVTFEVVTNPVLQQVELGDTALETLEVDEVEVPVQQAVDNIFGDQYGDILNFRDLQIGIQDLNQLYQENGYVLAQVIDTPQVSEDGVVTLEVVEGVIEDIEIRFVDEEGNDTDEEGNPIEGRTRDFIITREFASQPGDVFNQPQIEQDLQRAFGLGIFEDVRISLNPGSDPRTVDVIVNVVEGNTGSIAAGLGVSSASGLFGTLSYQEQNLGGNNQRLAAELQIGTRDLLFDVSFTDPWIGGDPYRTSYTVSAFSRRSISLVFDGGENEVELDNGDRPRVQRLGGGISFGRPLDEWLGWENWRGSLGFQYQHVTIQDADGEQVEEDELGNPLSFSGEGEDDLFTLQLSAVNDNRNSVIAPTSGSLLRLSTEQSIPIGMGSILFNRLRASYSYYIPVDFTNFMDGPETLAFNVQAGTVFGDLPPYEAFALGGTDSVRGYESGDVGSGRSFAIATIEYRFPVISIIGGALFFDFGTDFGTGDDVPGEPAVVRDKPGTGFGFGAGVRIQTPLGQIRIDYAINDEGDGRFHFGIGERF